MARRSLLACCFAWMVAVGSPLLAQQPREVPEPRAGEFVSPPSPVAPPSYAPGAPEGWLNACTPGDGCGLCAPLPGAATCDAGLFAGADLLLVRPHFSEAYEFVRVTQLSAAPTTLQIDAQNSQFDYDASIRAFLGYRSGDGSEFRFTYWDLPGDTSADAQATAINEFLVDPLGNLALPGSSIRTNTSVETQVYDMEFSRPVSVGNPCWDLRWSAGVRIADVSQDYDATIFTATGAQQSRVSYFTDFVGAGPRAGFEARRNFASSFSVFARANGSLLVGDIDVDASTTSATLVAAQHVSQTRTIPVAEIEIGTSCWVMENVNLSLGWLFQAWFDLGASGGDFGGFYSPADDSNILSYDGLFLRAEWNF